MPNRILSILYCPKILTALLTRNALKLSWTPGGIIRMELHNLTGKLLFFV